MGYMDEYKFWLESDCFDEKTKEELEVSQMMTKRSRTDSTRI